jgi:thiol-disulfide isomerase/thioredoxin
MKKYLFTILLILFSIIAFAQTAVVEIKFVGAKDKNVAVLLPVDGAYFYPNRTLKEFNKDSVLTLNLKIDQICRVDITNSKKNHIFYIEPGKSSITIDLNKKNQNSVDFVGPSAAGQLLATKRASKYYYDQATIYRKTASAAAIIELAKADEAKELKAYQELLQQDKISKAFYTQIQKEIKYFYLATLGFVATDVYFSAKKPNSKDKFSKEYADLWDGIYKQSFSDKSDLITTDYYDFARYYSERYVDVYLQELKGIKQDRSQFTADDYLVTTYNNFEKNFKGEVREYLLASFLFNEIFQKKFQAKLVELNNRFVKAYPRSKYSPLIKNQVDEIISYHEKVKNEKAKDQKFVPNYAQINTLDDLMAVFKGKTVFVDIWATWCGPCKEEFEHGEGLEKFLKSKNAEMLYISMDNDKADQQWKDMIKYYQLAGNHIRVNAKLLQNLMDKLWDGKSYAIPRYLILKDGKLVNDRALRPSDKDKLYEQISAQL